MKKKTIVFYVLAGLFFVSGLTSLLSEPLGAICCIVIACVFFCLARKRPKADAVADVAASAPADDVKPEFLFEKIRVAGVTFDNDDGKSRQLMLRKIKFRDAPYADGLELGVEYYEYNGSPAYKVTVNGDTVGNVPADKVEYVDSLISASKVVGVTYISVYGGTDGKPFGAEITLKIKND